MKSNVFYISEKKIFIKLFLILITFLAIPCMGNKEIIWEKTTAYERETYGYPVSIAIHKNYLVLNYETDVEVRHLSNGELVWCDNIEGSTAFYAGDKHLFTIDKNTSLCCLYDYATGKKTLLTKLGKQKDRHFKLFTYKNDDIFIASQPYPVNDQLEKCTLIRFNLSKRKKVWSFKNINNPVAILAAQDLHKIFIAENYKLYFFTVNDKKVRTEKNVSLNHPISSLAISSDKLLYLTKSDSIDKIVVCDFNLNKIWEYKASEITDIYNPYHQSYDKPIFFIDKPGQELKCIDKKRVIWSYPLKANIATTNLSVYNNSSILLIENSDLSIISLKGEKTGSFSFSDSPTSTPIVDSNGLVYIGFQGSTKCFNFLNK